MRQQFLIPIVFLIAAIVFFHSILFGDLYFWDDIIEYVYPFSSYAAQHLKNLEIPFWNPFTFSGMPFAADFQTQTFYPLHWVYPLFLDDSGLLKPGVIEVMVVLHFVIAQLGMYFFARTKGLSVQAGIIAAIAYAFSGCFATRVIHPMIIYHLAIFPFVLATFDRGVFRSQWKDILACGLLLGLAIIAGHPQTTSYVLIFTLAYGIFRLVESRSESGFSIPKALAIGAVPFFMAGGLVAVQYLPAAELASMSERTKITYEKETKDSKLFASDGSMRPSQFLTAVVPGLFGTVSREPGTEDTFYLRNVPDDGVETHYYWDTAFYFGIGTLILSIIGFVRGISLGITRFFLIMSALALLYSMGSYGFLHPVLFNVPVLGSFRNPGRSLFWLVFGSSFMAGFAFDSLTSTKNGVATRTILLSAALPLAIALLAATGVLGSMMGAPESAASLVQGSGQRALIFGLLCTAAIYFAASGTLKPLIVGPVFSLLIFIDLHSTYNPFLGAAENPREKYTLSSEVTSFLAPRLPDTAFRVAMWDRAYALPRNIGPVSGIMLFEGYNPILLERRGPRVGNSEVTSDLLNIRYAFKLNPQTGQFGLIERPSAFQRARMVYKADVMSAEAVPDFLLKGGYDFTNSVVLERQPLNGVPGLAKDSVSHQIKCTKYGINGYTYLVKTDKPGVLCLSEIHYPAFRAYVDGQPVDLHRSNYSLQAVSVPAGEHSVEVCYESQAFKQGATISLATLGLSLLGLVFVLVRKEKSNR